MKTRMIIILAFLFLVSQVNAQENLVLKNQKDKMSYIIGMDIGNNLKKQSIDVEPNILAKGIKDALTGGKPLLSEQEIRETMTAFQNEMKGKQEVVAKQNKELGNAFLAENKKKEAHRIEINKELFLSGLELIRPVFAVSSAFRSK